jgi:EmrB/QacA subfamily drug resistance transporter
MSGRPDTAARSEAFAGYPGRWLAFVVLLVGALMDLIDSSIVNVALPTIRRELAASDTSLEWIASGYLLVFAVTLITAGRLGDHVGRKRLFLVGVLLFGVASLGSGLAQSPPQLILGRLVQGFAAGVMVPQVLATVRSLFAGPERASVFAVYGAIAGLAVAVGLLLGGVLTDANLFGWGWRTIFLVNVPVAAVVLVAGARVIPETYDPSTPGPGVVGTVLLTFGLVAIVYALLEGQSLGWPAWVWWLAGAGVVALAALVVIERRRRDERQALLPTSLFRFPAFSAGILIQLVFSAAMAGFFFVLTIWLQAGEGFSPLTSGLTTLAFSAGTIVFAGVPQRLIPRFGRNVLVVGGLLMAAGIGLAQWPAANSGTPIGGWDLALGLFVAGAGLALLVIPLANVIISAIPAPSAGAASGVLSTAQQLGGAIGIGVFGTIFFVALPVSGFLASFIETAPWVAAGFVLCAVLALALPSAAVAQTFEGGGTEPG